jgi:hypothetical protein
MVPPPFRWPLVLASKAHGVGDQVDQTALRTSAAERSRIAVAGC